MRPARRAAAALTVGALLAGAGGARAQGEGDLAALFARATEVEQTRGAAAGLDAALSLLDRALAGGSRQSDAALLAALDLLVGRAVAALDPLGGPSALAYRHPGALETVRERLERAYPAAAKLSPFAPAAIARAAFDLALHAGDAAAASVWRGRLGCVRAATVIGPLAWPPITAAARATPVERPGARLQPAYPGVPPFGGAVAPTVVEGVGCALDLYTTSALDGLRLVIVDVELPRPQRLAFELESRSTATLVVGGQTVLARGYAAGGGRVRQRGLAQVGAGRVRVVVRVGLNGEGATIGLQVLGEDGSPLPTSAPRPGDAAAGRARSATAVPLLAGAPGNDPERSLLAAAHLAMGDARTAEHLIEEGAGREAGNVIAPRAPLPALLYARALPVAGDLPDSRVTQLLGAAQAATLQAWPGAWEALLGKALLAVRQHGPVEGQAKALAEIAAARARKASADPSILALQAALAARADLRDLASGGLLELQRQVPGTPLLAQVDRLVGSRVGEELDGFLCGAPGLGRHSSDCLNLRVSRGDRQGALAEIERLRTLWAAPGTLLRAELTQRFALGEIRAAAALYERIPPAYRPVGMLAGLYPDDPRALRERLHRDVAATSDDPNGALAALSTLLGESPAPAWEAESPARIAADRRRTATPGAATLVLAHREGYDFHPSGLLRYTLYDLRRFSGTADVDRPEEVAPQNVSGRELRRTLRRRIFKPDGRVLDPEPRVGRQGRTDLSQLEPGDYLEEIAEGFSLPASNGQMSVATQDLLPERTSVQEATIEIRRPVALPLQAWAHPLLGRPTTARRGPTVLTTYTLRGAQPRRLETRTPPADRPVAVYAATARWERSGPLLTESLAALDDEDPFVARWARGLAEGLPRTDRPALIAAVVKAVGNKVKRADGSWLTDAFWAPTRAQRTSARATLELGDGSRTWLAYRALRELGLPAEIVVAEEEPFSADPRYPHRFGRFRHPLIVVQGSVWLDLEVRGPPLPPGRVSPQLLGRLAVDGRGRIFPVPAAAATAQATEIDIDLKLDEQGTARGTFTAAIRGRDAQLMAEELHYRVGLHRDQRLRAVVLGWLPSATVNDVALVSEEGAWEVSLEAGVELPGYAQADGAAFTVPGIEPLHNVYAEPPVATLGSTFAKHRGRDSALSIAEAVSYRLRRRIQLPGQARLQGERPVLTLREPHVEAARKVELRNDTTALDERFELSIPTAALDKRDYQRFVKAAARIDEVFQTPTRVVRASARR
jgi:hypothetical protein